MKKVKKSLLRVGSRDRLWTHVSNSRGFSSPRPSSGEREVGFRQPKYITHISDFVKKIHDSYSDRCRPGARPGCLDWRAICPPKILVQVNFAPNSMEFRALVRAFQSKNSGCPSSPRQDPGVPRDEHSAWMRHVQGVKTQSRTGSFDPKKAFAASNANDGGSPLTGQSEMAATKSSSEKADRRAQFGWCRDCSSSVPVYTTSCKLCQCLFNFGERRRRSELRSDPLCLSQMPKREGTLVFDQV